MNARTRHDPIVELECDVERAVNFIKASRNRSLFVCCAQFAVAKNQTGAPEGHTRGREVYAHVRVNTPAAIKFIQDAYGRQADKVTIRIAYSSNCVFIGRGA